MPKDENSIRILFKDVNKYIRELKRKFFEEEESKIEENFKIYFEKKDTTAEENNFRLEKLKKISYSTSLDDPIE